MISLIGLHTLELDFQHSSSKPITTMDRIAKRTWPPGLKINAGIEVNRSQSEPITRKRSSDGKHRYQTGVHIPANALSKHTNLMGLTLDFDLDPKVNWMELKGSVDALATALHNKRELSALTLDLGYNNASLQLVRALPRPRNLRTLTLILHEPELFDKQVEELVHTLLPNP